MKRLSLQPPYMATLKVLAGKNLTDRGGLESAVSTIHF